MRSHEARPSPVPPKLELWGDSQHCCRNFGEDSPSLSPHYLHHCMYIYICMHVCKCACMSYIHSYIHAYTHTYMHKYIHVYICLNTHIDICSAAHMYTHTQIAYM